MKFPKDPRLRLSEHRLRGKEMTLRCRVLAAVLSVRIVEEKEGMR
jgi:hypothetical protein